MYNKQFNTTLVKRLDMIKNDRDIKKYKQRIADLEGQVSLLNQQLESIQDYEKDEPENDTAILTCLYSAVKTISEDSESKYSKMCIDILSKTPETILNEIKNTYYKEGILACINVLRNKAEQARDLESDLTAITAESFIEALQKL